MDTNAPKPVPIVNHAGSTVFANIASLAFNVGTGQFQLIVGEQRFIEGLELPRRAPDETKEAIFELGRFAISPRAARQLLDSVVAAVSAYEENAGDLPTVAQYVARSAMTTLNRNSSRNDRTENEG